MENLEQNEVTENNYSKLNIVSPLSKYLAMVLFVTLPFIGGWVGYKYSPEKIVEIEKVIIKETKTIGTAQGNESSHSQKTTRVMQECPLDQSGTYEVVTDVTSELHIASRAILLKSGLSETYLNEHFTFLCGIEYSPTNQRVVWKYSIDEYTAFLEGIINPPERTGPNFTEIVGVLHDIQNPLRKTTAREKINECLDEEVATSSVKLVGGPRQFGYEYKPESILKNENGGLFMFGSTEEKEDVTDSSTFHSRSVVLNLETGACATDSHTMVND